MLPLRLLFLTIVAISAAIIPQRKESDAHAGMENYLAGICRDNDIWSEPTPPCEILSVIDYQCETGLDWDDTRLASDQTIPGCMDSCQSYDFERTCFCQSQFLDSAMGCYACYLGHGSESSYWLTDWDWTMLPDIMDNYCDPMADPTAHFTSCFNLIFSTAVPTSTGRFSDPLGFSKTDVSLYYYPSMTDDEAWSTTLSTIKGWSVDAIETACTSASSIAISTTASLSTYASRTVHSTHPTTVAPASDNAGHTSTSSNAPTLIPPIIIQPVPPSSSTKPLPSLVHKASALPASRVRLVHIVGIPGLVVIAALL